MGDADASDGGRVDDATEGAKADASDRGEAGAAVAVAVAPSVTGVAPVASVDSEAGVLVVAVSETLQQRHTSLLLHTTLSVSASCKDDQKVIMQIHI